jgi:hypothetical protein
LGYIGQKDDTSSNRDTSLTHRQLDDLQQIVTQENLYKMLFLIQIYVARSDLYSLNINENGPKEIEQDANNEALLTYIETFLLNPEHKQDLDCFIEQEKNLFSQSTESLQSIIDETVNKIKDVEGFFSEMLKDKKSHIYKSFTEESIINDALIYSIGGYINAIITKNIENGYAAEKEISGEELKTPKHEKPPTKMTPETEKKLREQYADLLNINPEDEMPDGFGLLPSNTTNPVSCETISSLKKERQ